MVLPLLFHFATPLCASPSFLKDAQLHGRKKFPFYFRKAQSGLLLNRLLFANDPCLFLVFLTITAARICQRKYWDLDAARMPIFTRYHVALHLPLRSPCNTWDNSNEADAPVLSQLALRLPPFEVLNCRVWPHIKGTTPRPAITLAAVQSFVCRPLATLCGLSSR